MARGFFYLKKIVPLEEWRGWSEWPLPQISDHLNVHVLFTKLFLACNFIELAEKTHNFKKHFSL